MGQKNNYFWLIERVTKPKLDLPACWCGICALELEFSQAASIAVRFVRKQDAELVASCFLKDERTKPRKYVCVQGYVSRVYINRPQKRGTRHE